MVGIKDAEEAKTFVNDLDKNYDEGKAKKFNRCLFTWYENTIGGASCGLEESRIDIENIKKQIADCVKKSDLKKVNIASASQDEKDKLIEEKKEYDSKLAEYVKELRELESKYNKAYKRLKSLKKNFEQFKKDYAEQEKAKEESEIKVEEVPDVADISQSNTNEDISFNDLENNNDKPKNTDRSDLDDDLKPKQNNGDVVIDLEDFLNDNYDESLGNDESLDNENKSVKITAAEAYANLLNNVSNISAINQFFSGKKINREVKKHLESLSDEEKQALLSMFENPVELINFKVPDVLSNALISSYVADKQVLLNNDADVKDIAEVSSVISGISMARDAKNARIDKPFKTVTNKKEVLLLSKKNKEIREAYLEGDKDKATTLGQSLGKLVNDPEGFGDTKKANEKKPFTRGDGEAR